MNRPLTDASYERQVQTSGMSRSVLQEGWSAIWTPKVNFANHKYPSAEPTVIRYEFPFHALLSWPLHKVFGEQPWVGRLVSIFFSILCLYFLWQLTLQFFPNQNYQQRFAFWLLSSTPIFLYYGQAPMPDVISLAGLLMSIAFAHKKQILYSAMAFAFALLAKPSALPFALPVVLLFYRQDKEYLKQFVLWNVISVLPLLLWSAGALKDPLGSWNLLQAMTDADHKGFPHDLMDSQFYFKVAAYLCFFGVGVFSFLAIPSLQSILSNGSSKALFYIGAVISCLFVYIMNCRYMWREPQYTLPVLFFVVLFLTEGSSFLLKRKHIINKLGLALLVVVHTYMVFYALRDLRSDRVPHLKEIAELQNVLPVDAKVLQVSPSFGAAPSFYLKRRTLLFVRNPGQSIAENLDAYRALGYTHLLFMDYTLRDAQNPHSRQWIKATHLHPDLLHIAQSLLVEEASSEHVILYSL